MTPRPSDDLVLGTFNEIGLIAQLATTLFERAMPDGMTLAQLTVLDHFVRVGGPSRPSELARSFQVSRATMTSTLARLEAKTLVAVAVDERDARGRQVTITDTGAAMRERCLVALRPTVATLESEIGLQAFRAVLPQLRVIRAALDEIRSA